MTSTPAPATVHIIERAGVRTLWIPAEGAVHVSLAFNVGLLDEPYARGGITHLVEHLALTALSDPAYDINGFVSSSQTAFTARGSVEEVGAYLEHVAGALGDLPVDRLDMERGVLEAESGSSESFDTVPFLLFLRWGVQAPGRRGLPELGLRTADADTVRAWARDRFTASAATLCWVGPEPPEQSWRLPVGPAAPSPPPPRPLVPLPFAVEGDDVVVALGMTVPNSISAAIFSVRSTAPNRSRAGKRLSRALGRRMAIKGRLTHPNGSDAVSVARLL